MNRAWCFLCLFGECPGQVGDCEEHPASRWDAKTSTIIYFTSSDPHHDMSGGGCQVRVFIYFYSMDREQNCRWKECLVLECTGHWCSMSF